MLPTYMFFPTHSIFRQIPSCVLAGMLAVFGLQPALAQGPNITYNLKAASGLGPGLQNINSIAADSAGNVFITDTRTDSVYKETLNPDGTYTQSTISTGASNPHAVAVDSSDNLYVADGAHVVYKETSSGNSYTESTVASTFTNAASLAVDAAGNVYVTDTGTGSAYLEKISGNTYTQSTIAGGLNFPGGIAVDTSGNVYIADTGNSRALKETLASGTYTQSVVIDSNMYTDNGYTIPPDGIAVDSAGAVIIANANFGIYKAVPNEAAYTTSEVIFGNNYGIVTGVGASIDAHGNLYLADNNSVYMAAANELAETLAEDFGTLNVGTLAPAQTATFTFDVGGALAATPYAVSTQGDLTLDFQPAATQGANVCVTGKTYNPGDTCTVAATFTPTRPGVRYGAIALFAPSGTPIATSFLQGIGVSPQVSFSPGTYDSNLGQLFGGGLAVDSSGNFIFAAESNGAVLDSFTNAHPLDVIDPTFLTGFPGSDPSGIHHGNPFGNGYVVDGAGNVIFSSGFLQTAGTGSGPSVTSFGAYDVNPTIAVPQTGTVPIHATNYGNALLASIPFTSTTVTPTYNNRPAVDGAGNLYFPDDSGNQILEEQYIHGAYNKLLVVASGLNNPGDVVVDAAGAVYTADTGNNRIVKESPDGSGAYTQTVVDSGFATPPEGLAIDRVGNLYVALFNNSTNNNVPFIVKETLANNTYTRSNLTITGSEALDVDSAGNVFAIYPASSSSTFISAVGALDVATPPSFTFAQTAVGSTSADSPKTVTIINNGNAPLSFSNFAITKDFDLSTSSTCSGAAPLAPATSCTLLISFVPTQSGVANGTLTVTDNHLGNSSSTQVIKLNGQATGSSPVINLTPSSVAFPDTQVGGASAAQAITVANTGTATANLASITLGGADASSFSENSGCGTTLAVNATCTVNITFIPTAGNQTFNATLSVVSNDPASPATATLTGKGLAAGLLTIAPTTQVFPSTAVGTTSAAQTSTITNATPQAVDLSIGTLTDSTDFAESDNCGGIVNTGATCTVTFTFKPQSTGALTSTYSIHNLNTPNSPLTVALSGTATPAPAPVAVLTPATLTYLATTGTTSAAQTATLTNSGTAALSISSISLTGTNSAAFASTNTCGSSLAAGASCTISVTFDPASAGTDTATLAVSDNVPGSPQTSTLTGVATAPPPAADFSIAAAPASQSTTPGSSAVYLVNLTSVNSSFTQQVALAASGLPPGATVSFSPTSVTPGSSGSSSTMTVQTISQQASAREGPARWPLPAGLASVALLILPFRRRRRIFLSLCRLFILLGASGALTACGGGFALPQAPSATYTITVTGTSGSTQHSTTVQLTVR